MESDHEQPRAHEHEASHGHGFADPALLSSALGTRAVRSTLLIFLAASSLELLVACYSGSVSLLADAAHNLGDTVSSLPLWVAFRMAGRKPTTRFTYGYGRLEDLGGLFILLLILASCAVAGYAAVERLLNPQPMLRTGAVMIAAGISFLANEAAAFIRIKTGREIGSAALTADGYHARTDGLASLAVLCGAVAVRRGYPIADPVVCLLMVPMLLKLAWESGKVVLARMVDAVDPEIVEAIRRVAARGDDVRGVADIRARWLGHQLMADVSIAVEPGLRVDGAHRVALEARRRLLHDVRFLSDVTVHICPQDSLGSEGHRQAEHRRDEPPSGAR